MSAGIIAVLI
ncbi:Protein of unknown function [Bacillus wiedmannii]|nr:Protein of unknown function [Bacillus wiedmannii]